MVQEQFLIEHHDIS